MQLHADNYIKYYLYTAYCKVDRELVFQSCGLLLQECIYSFPSFLKLWFMIHQFFAPHNFTISCQATILLSTLVSQVWETREEFSAKCLLLTQSPSETSSLWIHRSHLYLKSILSWSRDGVQIFGNGSYKLFMRVHTNPFSLLDLFSTKFSLDVLNKIYFTIIAL